MTKVLVERELLERVVHVMDECIGFSSTANELRAMLAQPAHDVASVPEWWKIERSFDVLPRPCVDGKSHQPTIKIVLPACAPDDMDAFDVRDQIAETVRKLLYAAPSAPAAPDALEQAKLELEIQQ